MQSGNASKGKGIEKPSDLIWRPNEKQLDFAYYICNEGLNPKSITHLTQASKEINVDIRTIKGWWFETGFESWLSEERAKWYLGQAEVHTRMLSEKAIESGNASDHKKAVDAAHKTSAAIFSQAKDSEARKGQSGVNTDDVDATQLIKDANKHNLTVINGNGE